MKPFPSRTKAGQSLAEKLKAFEGKGDVVVAGVSNGGMIVAKAVAEALELPLEVIVTQKITVPGEPTLFLGAVSERGTPVGDSELYPLHGIDMEQQRLMETQAEVDVLCRATCYRQGKKPMPLKGKTVILVDDGILTGMTIAASLETVRERGAAEVVVAAPVGTASPLASIAEVVDAVVVPTQMAFVGRLQDYYEAFPEVSDDEVIQIMQVLSIQGERQHKRLEEKAKKKVRTAR